MDQNWKEILSIFVENNDWRIGMNQIKIIEQAGLLGGVLMPFWNIPLMIRIIQRRTSSDISLTWLFGVWGCIVAMYPSTRITGDVVLRSFGISNLVLFSLVVLVVLFYRRTPKD